MTAYYNEFCPESAAMLRQLIKDGIIAPGDVDERSILEVSPDDLKPYKQCHLFAGIGGWSMALRSVGWDDDRPVWTGSAPCQPFSAAGQHKGMSDERHLFPYWADELIGKCRPPIIFGEQVEKAIAKGWLDDVYQRLEGYGYAVGSAVLPSCSVGSPHRRERIFFVGHAQQPRLQGRNEPKADKDGWQEPRRPVSEAGLWDGAEWVDTGAGGKKRMVQPGIPLLVDGVQHRRPVCHAFGNAIVPEVAAEFIISSMSWAK